MPLSTSLTISLNDKSELSSLYAQRFNWLLTGDLYCLLESLPSLKDCHLIKQLSFFNWLGILS
ncbi:hypothetical protein N9123_02135, partial [Pseudomonadales bacterium]|nr:hypothetical protein [Pseudomonadales bacterium]